MMGGVTVKTLDYFEECYCFPALGKLTREHIFYQMGLYPILFVCKDGNKNRYLCSCCRLGEEWIINQVSENALVAFIEDKITIREVDRKSVVLGKECPSLCISRWSPYH